MLADAHILSLGYLWFMRVRTNGFERTKTCTDPPLFTRDMQNRASFCTANSTAICNHGLHNFRQKNFKNFSRIFQGQDKNYLINRHSCTKMFLRYPWVLQVLSHRGWAKFSSAKWSNFTEKMSGVVKVVNFKEFSRTKEIKYFLTPGGGVLPYKWL